MTVEWGIALMCSIFLLIAVLVCYLCFQLMASQGRLLTRIDRLHELIVLISQGQQPERMPDAKPLLPGTEISAFRLTAVSGETISSENFAGKPLVLVNWSTGCGYCSVIAGELSKYAAAMREHGGELVLVSDNDKEANSALVRRHSFPGTVLLRGRSDGQPEFFHGVPTPAAYWVDASGRISRPLAIGAGEVPLLAREAATGMPPPKPVQTRPLNESRITRDGLSKGTPAPDFRLPTVAGGEVALSDYRGKRVLLVFTDPNCEPCDVVAAGLAARQAVSRESDLQVLMVGRGDLEENRRKAAQNGIRFEVAVQNRWEISRLYGIFLTPVAFLIDEDGIIAAPVLKGSGEILSNVPLARTVGAV